MKILRPSHNLAHEFPELAAQWRKAGVRLVRVEYHGHSGDGRICGLRIMDYQYREMSAPPTYQQLLGLVLFLAVILKDRHPDWPCGDGSCGDFAWDLADDSLVHVHRYHRSGSEVARYEGVAP